jgi:hypothetical protein
MQTLEQWPHALQTQPLQAKLSPAALAADGGRITFAGTQ